MKNKYKIIFFSLVVVIIIRHLKILHHLSHHRIILNLIILNHLNHHRIILDRQEVNFLLNQLHLSIIILKY